jgi:large repetitive protein
LCDTATVEIDVKPNAAPATTNLPPNAQSDVAITKVDLPKTGTVALNDSDPNLGQILTYSPVSTPANGTVVLNANGSYTYTPTSGFVGNDAFTYKVCDNGTPGLCDSATVNITVLPNDKITKPLAINDINVTFIGTPVSGNVLTNDDGNGFPITSTLIVGVNGIPKHGTLTLLPNGNYTYTPAAGYVGKDSVQYKICNNQIPVECDTAWINLKVIPYPSATENNAPIALPDMFVTDKGKPVVSTISGFCSNKSKQWNTCHEW